MSDCISRVRELKYGDCFVLKYTDQPISECDVWVKGNYVSSIKKYFCVRLSDPLSGNFFDPYRCVFEVELVGDSE